MRECQQLTTKGREGKNARECWGFPRARRKAKDYEGESWCPGRELPRATSPSWRYMSELAHRAAGAWPARPHGALREQRSQRKHTLQNEPGNAAKLRFFFNALTWLACQDSNLGMEESKSTWFALFVKTHSEKSRKFDLNPFKRLTHISECRDARRALSLLRAPALRRQRSQVRILSGAPLA